MPKYYSPDKKVFYDRDDLAALNLLVIGRSWYYGQGRQQAFRRRKGEFGGAPAVRHGCSHLAGAPEA
jgi:hypothetical protein